jgi:hypothetical protein
MTGRRCAADTGQQTREPGTPDKPGVPYRSILCRRFTLMSADQELSRESTRMNTNQANSGVYGAAAAFIFPDRRSLSSLVKAFW